MKRNEVAKICGLNHDNQVSPSIEVGRRYPISNRWNLLKLLKSRKKQIKTMSTELNNISDSID